MAEYYLSRTFVKQNKDKETCDAKKDEIPEETIYEETQKVVLIADSAGSGKSTVLTKLATTIKRNYTHLWVIKINLTDYTRFLRDSLGENREEVHITELLNSHEATKLNELEKPVFSMYEKIILMLDGVDEITPTYTNLILNLLVQCQHESNFAKLFITTRPHLVQALEERLNVQSYKMVPFSRQNQIDFLIRYWMHNLTSNDKTKCERYAQALLDKMSSRIKLSRWESSFGAVPLQLKMMADIFQEKCGEFLVRNETVPELPKKLNVAKLYDIFIEKKQNIFVDRGNQPGNVAADYALTTVFEKCLEYHRNLALRVLFDQRSVNLFSCNHPNEKDVESSVLRMGLVQNLGDEFVLLHRTFAEYFVAQSIFRELTMHNTNVEFQKLLIDEILVEDKFYIVRIFLDNFLQDVVDHLPPGIFKEYRNKHKNYNDSYGNLIFLLSAEGCLAILRLILKSINFNTKCKTSKIGEYLRKINKKINTLNNLKIVMLKSGLNIRDEKGSMPLHYALKNGHLDTVRFLIQEGADINNKDGDDNTLLHLAANSDNPDIVKFLAPNDASIDSKNCFGNTALHLAAEMGNWDTVECLLAHGADIIAKNSDGRTVLHLAVLTGTLDNVQRLKKHNPDFNSIDNFGRTALHLATERGDLNIVKYLVENDAVISCKDNGGCTALCLANKFNKLDIADYLGMRS